MIPATLVIIFVLLHVTFTRFDEALLIVVALPLALVGGFWLMYLLGYHASCNHLIGQACVYTALAVSPTLNRSPVMRKFAVATAAALAILASPAGAQSSGMKGMEMQGDMKGMNMDKGSMKDDKSQMAHKGVGVVKKVDAKAGTVTIDHEPIKSMSWPKMAMTFRVKDKAMLEKVGEGKKVEFEFEARGKEHVITSLK